ncbi:O-antigen ligase family protein [Microbacterium marinum]|uniref:O-antigen ligase family protein n=1 Tax=Microbacterium marinum TaxID=421115 RepID=UPI003850E49F
MSDRALEWRDRLATWWGGAWRWCLIAGALTLTVYFLLPRVASNAELTAIAIAILVIGAALTMSVSMAIPLVAMPALFVVERVGFGGTDLSASDVLLAAAFGSAVLLGHRPYSTAMRQLLWLNLVYQFATLFTVIINPFTQNTVEWFHAWMLISGALVVGWALGRAGYARAAFILMLAMASVIAVGALVTAVVQFAGGEFGGVYPQWPFPMHKNAAGTMMAFVALIAHLHPDWSGLRTAWARMAFWLLIAGVLATQSRQAIIGLVVAFVVLGLRRDASPRARAAILLVIPAIWLVWVTVVEQVESQNRFNSFFQRLNWFREVYAFWKHSPVFGHGLRYWYTDVSAAYQPPQAELEVAASSGLVGLTGFVVMWVGFIIVLWRMDPRFGSLALAVVGSRIVQAQFDLFWVAGQVSIPFVIAGICVGAAARHEAEPSPAGFERMVHEFTRGTRARRLA